MKLQILTPCRMDINDCLENSGNSELNFEDKLPYSKTVF